MSAYARVPFFEAVRDATGGNPKVQRKRYLPEGPVPVLDQGQDFIAGYTTTDNAYTGELPVVLFGDHTRAFKYVDFPFALGADGVKALVPQEGFEASFLYWYFRNVDISSAGYSRHFKFLRELSVCKPPLSEQRRIVGILNRAVKIERLRKQAAERLRELIPALFVNMFGDEQQVGIRFPRMLLREAAAIASGATKGRRIDSVDAVEVPYLRVANVQDGFLAMEEIKTITIRRGEEQQYALAPGDLVMTEGGDPENPVEPLSGAASSITVLTRITSFAFGHVPASSWPSISGISPAARTARRTFCRLPRGQPGSPASTRHNSPAFPCPFHHWTSSADTQRRSKRHGRSLGLASPVPESLSICPPP